MREQSKSTLGFTLDRAFAVSALLMDLVVVFVAMAMAYLIRYRNISIIFSNHIVGTSMLYWIVFVLLSDMEGLYVTRTASNPSMHGYRAVRICLTATVLYSIVLFIFRLPSDYFINSRLVIVIAFFMLLLFYYLLRIVALPYIVRFLLGPFLPHKVKVLLFGDEEHYRTMLAICNKSALYREFLNIILIDEDCPEERQEWIEYHLRKAEEYGTSDLCICDDKADFGDFAVSAWELHQRGMYISFFSKIFEQLGYFDPWLSTKKRAAKTFFTSQMSKLGEGIWRVVDFFGALLALVVLLPFMALIALAIKIESRGPVLFLQYRVGKDMEEFCFPKFRSMTHDPEGRHKRAHRKYFEKYANGHAAHEDKENGYKLEDTSRITRVGKVLRRTSLDELPQFWCVLAGKMSLVGPRPCIPYELEHYAEWHKLRFRVKPGLTGVWQVYGRSRLPMDAAQFMDFCYVMNRSIGLNVRLILKTFPVMLMGKGGV